MGAGIIYSIMGSIYRSFSSIFKKVSDMSNSNVDASSNVTGDIDSRFFEKVMEEIESGYKDKGLEGKALALSEGDTVKANALYLKFRAEALRKSSIAEQNKINIEKKLVTRKNLENKKEKKRKELNVTVKKYWSFFLMMMLFLSSLLLIIGITIILLGSVFGVNDEPAGWIGLVVGLIVSVWLVNRAEKS